MWGPCACPRGYKSSRSYEDRHKAPAHLLIRPLSLHEGEKSMKKAAALITKAAASAGLVSRWYADAASLRWYYPDQVHRVSSAPIAPASQPDGSPSSENALFWLDNVQ